ncbi:peptidylprolyl isomerase SurA [Candidatus Curculioniphilus buchneri]|uniref:peptidylprolyl isomerase SurA n=1 Tax=Candidatus Curculioniphilus buchneri TaxID=690594 RepID=UPI00376EC2EE
MNKFKKCIFGFILVVQAVIAAPLVLDKIVVIVNNNIILESDVKKMFNIVKHEFQQKSHQMPDDIQLRRQIINQLIMDQLLLQMVEYADISISDQQLDQVINNIAAQHNMSLDQLHNRLACEGIEYETYRSQIRKEILIAKIRNDKVSSRIAIMPQEVDSLVKQITKKTHASTEFNLSHIFIPLPENSSQDQIEKAKLQVDCLIAQHKNGEDFGKLAMSYSADKQALQSGYIGWNKLEELPSLFVTYLEHAQKGNLIGPIRSGVGFHILKVNDIYGGEPKVNITEVQVRHIVLRPSILMTHHQILSQLKDISNQIRNGHITFTTAAKQLSDNLSSTDLDMDLEWHSIEKFDPELRNVLINLKKNEVSEPIHASDDGWHLMQLIDIRDVDRTDSMQKNRAYRLLFNRKFAEESQIWMQEQRASAYIKIFDNSNE